MSQEIFFVVLFAAFLHVGWNALIKGGHDKIVSMLAVVIGQGLFGLLTLPFAPMPAVASWPYIGAAVFLHIGYQFFLIAAYRVGDLTQVYPVARGVAPVLVTLASAIFLGVAFETMQILAVGLIVCGVISLGLVRQSSGSRTGSGLLLAVITGCFIAAYTLNDGLGARLAGTSLGFYSWSAPINAALFWAVVALRQPAATRGAMRIWRTGLIGGGASYTAYALVIHAFLQAPIALVAALRETGIVFALLIGVIKLKERLSLGKVLATLLTLSGAALLRLA